LALKKIQTTAYHPRCDGLVERFNKTIIEQLRKLTLTDDFANWEHYLPYALFAYRAMPNETTKESPFFLMYGRQPNFRLDNMWLRKTTLDLNYDSYKFFVSTTLDKTHKLVMENIERAQRKQKQYYDKKTKEKNFKVGELVALNCPQKAKLDKLYKGPFVVVSNDENLPPNTIKIAEVGDNKKIILVTKERVKPWYNSEFRVN